MPSQRREKLNYSSVAVVGGGTNSAAIVLLIAAATGSALIAFPATIPRNAETPIVQAEGGSSAHTYTLAARPSISIPTFTPDSIAESVDPLAAYETFSEPNWDGYGAEPISTETLGYARQLLSVMPETFGPPDIAPAGDGSITLEWVPDDHPKLRKLFLDIGPGEKWRAYWKLRSGEFGRRPGTSFASETAAILEALFNDLS